MREKCNIVIAKIQVGKCELTHLLEEAGLLKQVGTCVPGTTVTLSPRLQTGVTPISHSTFTPVPLLLMLLEEWQGKWRQLYANNNKKRISKIKHRA